MQRNANIFSQIDYFTIVLYLLIALFGWVNIYGATFNFEQTSIFDFSNRAGKQFVWIVSAIVFATFILIIDDKTYDILAYVFYAFWLIVLIITPLLAHNINGSMSWITLGPISLQPAELAKCITALALAKYMSQYNYKIQSIKDLIIPAAIILIPMAIIIVWQRETGSALVFAAFMFPLFRQGMSGYVLLIAAAAVFFFIIVIKLSAVALPLGTGSFGITLSLIIILFIIAFFLYFQAEKRTSNGRLQRLSALIILATMAGVYSVALIVNIFFKVNFEYLSVFLVAATLIYLTYLALRCRSRQILFLIIFSLFSAAYAYSCNFAFQHVLQPHQRARIEVLLNLKEDPTGVGYNVNQAKIAIASGGFAGKGYLQGTQTKLQFVPEQATDFIFCTVGEEWGFVGSTLLIILYTLFILRIIALAERQKQHFARIYGYSVASIFFMHLAINIGMVLGLLPVIGIPLPLFSYGGSSLWSFTILLFIFLKLDATRSNQL